MADIEDLGIKSFSEMDKTEALELLRQIRLGRRTPVKTTKTYTKKSKKEVDVNASQAEAILKILGGN